MYKKYRYYWYAIAFIFWSFAPIISIPLFLYVIFLLHTKTEGIFFYLLLISLSFGLIAYTGYSNPMNSIETDIVRYYAQFDVFANVSDLLSFFIVFWGYGGIPYSVFNFVMFCFAKCFPDTPQLMTFFWITLSYLFLCLFVKELTLKKKEYFFYLLIVMLFGTTFFMYEVELLKQSVAIAIAAYSFALKRNNKKKSDILYALSVLIHPSMIVFIFVLIFFNRLKNIFKISILLGAIVFALVDFNRVVSIFFPQFADHSELYSSISIRPMIHYVILLLYSFIFILIFIDKKGMKNCDNKLLNISFITYCILLSQFGSIHNFGRYIYLYSPFYVLSLYALLLCHMYRKDKRFLQYSFFFVFIMLNFSFTLYYLNSDYANIFMENSILELFISNAYTILIFS